MLRSSTNSILNNGVKAVYIPVAGGGESAAWRECGSVGACRVTEPPPSQLLLLVRSVPGLARCQRRLLEQRRERRRLAEDSDMTMSPGRWRCPVMRRPAGPCWCGRWRQTKQGPNAARMPQINEDAIDCPGMPLRCHRDRLSTRTQPRFLAVEKVAGTGPASDVY